MIGSGSVIRDQQDNSESNEPMNSFPRWIRRFLLRAMLRMISESLIVIQAVPVEDILNTGGGGSQHNYTLSSNNDDHDVDNNTDDREGGGNCMVVFIVPTSFLIL